MDYEERMTIIIFTGFLLLIIVSCISFFTIWNLAEENSIKRCIQAKEAGIPIQEYCKGADENKEDYGGNNGKSN